MLALLTRGTASREKAAQPTMMAAITAYTRGQDCHWPAQMRLMPPERIMARR